MAETDPYDQGFELLCNDDAAALPLLEAAVALQPDRALAHLHLAWAHSNLGHHDAAKTSAQRAHELDSQDPYLAVRRLYILFAAHDTEAALEAATHALTLSALTDDDRRDVRLMRCWMLMRTSPTAAISEADTLVTDHPTDAEVLAAKGCALAAACRWKEGLVWLDKAIAAAPEDPRFPMRRDQIEQAEIVAEHSISKLQKAAKRKPQDPTRWRELGLVLAKYARLNEALTAFDRAHALEPASEDDPDPLTLSALMVEATARSAVVIGNIDPIG
jgi:tetratricopeptide (TPR) repeat protein